MPRNTLLAALTAALPDLQDAAAADDAAAAFPAASLDHLKSIGILTATLPESLAGLAFGEGPAGAQDLAILMQRLGEASLSLARLVEAHINALQLILRYGSRTMIEQTAGDAANGHLFALWVTDDPASPLTLNGNTLSGRKNPCSGAGHITRALVTAGSQMLVVPLEPHTRVYPSSLTLSGLRATNSAAMDFCALTLPKNALLGAPGDYLREPLFSAGAWRASAAALGCLTALVKLHRNALTRRARHTNPHQAARFGQLLIAHKTAKLWVDDIAPIACLESHASDHIVAAVGLVRIAVEAACLDALRLTQRGLGLPAFLVGHPAERLCRDLATYLRQPAPDEILESAAMFFFNEDVLF